MLRIKMLKKISFIIFCLSLLFVFSASADDLSDYTKAVENAQKNAITPTGWKATNLVVIADEGSVIVRTFTKFLPDAAAGQATHTYPSDATWVTTGTELKDYWSKHNVKTTNVQEETFRVLGMPTKKLNSNNTHHLIYEFKISADVNHIQRPTRDPSIASQPQHVGSGGSFLKPSGMSTIAFNNFENYYTTWAKNAFINDDKTKNYPWTQLGYTYRWGKGDTFNDIRGLSEFIVLGGTPVTVHAVYTVQSALYNDGTGTGNFRVTGAHGAVDQILAGRKYQSTGNAVYVEKNGAVSGGRGIEIFSLGYTVSNDGLITVSADKNIAVLFSGDTKFGGSGKNILVNSGTISGSDAAIASNQGDTQIILKGGELKGAITLGSGNDELEVAASTKIYLPIYVPNDTAPISGVETVRFSAPAQIYLEAKNGTPESLVGKQIKIFDKSTTVVSRDNAKFVNYDVVLSDDGTVKVNKYTPPSNPSGGGGGGCNSGFIGVFLLLPFFGIIKNILLRRGFF